LKNPVTKAFGTIITADYLHYALALNDSLLKFQTIPLYVLIVDRKIDQTPVKKTFPNINILYLDDIQKTKLAHKIITKYQGVNDDALRWSLKPVLLNYLTNKYQKAIYLDCDLYFFNDFEFVFEELDHNNILITPHWRNKSPGTKCNSFEFLFSQGLYNAGFVACNKKAKIVMDWWAKCCEYKCEKILNIGIYDDQAYLNLIPIYFDNIKILKHQGCNVAEWNYEECARIKIGKGEVLINGIYPIVFVHFTKQTIYDIKIRKDILLTTHLTEFEATIEKYRHHTEQYRLKTENIESVEQVNLNTPNILFNHFIRIKEKLRIRTRIKKFIEG